MSEKIDKRIVDAIAEDQANYTEGGMDIVFGDYRFFRSDKRNLDLVRYKISIAKRDIKDGSGKILVRKGEEYVAKEVIGYFGRLQPALEALLEDKVTSAPADSLETLFANLRATKQLLTDAIKVS